MTSVVLSFKSRLHSGPSTKAFVSEPACGLLGPFILVVSTGQNGLVSNLGHMDLPYLYWDLYCHLTGKSHVSWQLCPPQPWVTVNLLFVPKFMGDRGLGLGGKETSVPGFSPNLWPGFLCVAASLQLLPVSD